MKTELTDEMIRKSFQDIQTFERVSFVLSIVFISIICLFIFYMIYSGIKFIYSSKYKSDQKKYKGFLFGEDYDDMPPMKRVIYVWLSWGVIALFLLFACVVLAYTCSIDMRKELTYRVETAYACQGYINYYEREYYETIQSGSSYTFQKRTVTDMVCYLYIANEQNPFVKDCETTTVEYNVYQSFSKEFQEAYIVIDESDDRILSVWNQNEYHYEGQNLSSDN